MEFLREDGCELGAGQFTSLVGELKVGVEDQAFDRFGFDADQGGHRPCGDTMVEKQEDIAEVEVDKFRALHVGLSRVDFNRVRVGSDQGALEGLFQGFESPFAVLTGNDDVDSQFAGVGHQYVDPFVGQRFEQRDRDTRMAA